MEVDTSILVYLSKMVALSMILSKIGNIFVRFLNKSKSIIESQEFLLKSKASPEDFTRKRKMPFQDLIRFMLTRRRGSTQNELERYFDSMDVERNMTQQAFSEARLKVKDTAFSTLFYSTVESAYEGTYKTWSGYRVLAVDGSKIALPDIELLGRIYGTMGADSSSPTAQASICYDVQNRYVVDALIEPLATDERTLALEHVKNLDKGVRFDHELAIFDRGYPSFCFMHSLTEAGITFLMRVKRGFSSDIDAQTEADGIVVLRKAGYQVMPVRVIKFLLPTGETETLVTTLWEPSLTTDDFKKLYFMRWPVETRFDEVKNKLEIENFTGNSVLAVRQDFYATMYMTNMVAAAWWDAQEIVVSERANKDNKYEYQVNVNHEIGVLKDRLIFALTRPNPAVEVEKILLRLAKRVCPIKPGRSFKRNKSPRKSKFHSNMRSNC
jgi:hypothetical protein